jgi:hypothetical protein
MDFIPIKKKDTLNNEIENILLNSDRDTASSQRATKPSSSSPDRRSLDVVADPKETCNNKY